MRVHAWFIAILATYSLGTLAAWKQPVTPWGEPDIQGLWPLGNVAWTPLQRDKKLGNQLYMSAEEYEKASQGLGALFEGARKKEEKEGKVGMGHWVEAPSLSRQTSFIVEPLDGQLPPLTAEGQLRRDQMRSSWPHNAPYSSENKESYDSFRDFDSWDRCITRGMPASMLPFKYNNGVQVLQSPGYVVIRLEMIHEARIIPTRKMPPLPKDMLFWMGSSRGHWEGNTLVIKTTNFQPGQSATNLATNNSPFGNATPVSTSAVLTEKLTRTSAETMDYEFTWDDPVVFTAPWKVSYQWKLDPTYKFFEYACQEGNVIVENYVSSWRAGKKVQKATHE